MEDTLGQDLNNLLFKDILFKDMWGNETKGQVISIGIDERDGYVQVNVNTGYPENMISKDNIIEVLTEAAQTVESDDKLFTKSQIMDELKRETDNFTIPEDTYRYCFEEEAEYAKEVLMRKGYECDLGYDDSNWVTVHFYKSNDMNESYSKTYQITVKYHNEPNAKIEARSAKDRKDLEYQLNIDDEVEWYDFDEERFIGESFEEIVENKLETNYNINERVASSSSFVELEGFKRDWKDLGLNDDDLRDLQNLIINNPSSSIPLGSNVYKIRFSPERLNRGKDTANRVIYIEVIKSNVIYLATAFSKSEEANISKKEEDTLREFAKILNK